MNQADILVINYKLHGSLSPSSFGKRRCAMRTLGAGLAVMLDSLPSQNLEDRRLKLSPRLQQKNLG